MLATTKFRKPASATPSANGRPPSDAPPKLAAMAAAGTSRDVAEMCVELIRASRAPDEVTALLERAGVGSNGRTGDGRVKERAKPVAAVGTAPRGRGLKLLVLEAAQTFRRGFSVEDLTVRCWELWPAVFGMRGHRGHADKHKVRGYLDGEKGLVQRGQLRKASEGLFEVAES